MNKKKLIIFTPNPFYATATNFVDAINLYSKRFTAHGVYVEESPYDRLSEEQKKDWTNLYSSAEFIDHLLELYQDSNSHFLGISTRSVEIFFQLFLLHHGLHDIDSTVKISFDTLSTPEEGKKENSLDIPKSFFTRLCFAGRQKGLFGKTENLDNNNTFLAMALSQVTMSYASQFLDNYLRHKDFCKRLAFWWCGSPYRQRPDSYNALTDQHNIQTFAHLDLLRLNEKSLPLAFVYDFDLSEDKYENFTAIHTPGLQMFKGTDIVKEVANNLSDIKFDIYEGHNFLPGKQVILERAKSHVCIDKITENSILGLSGAMGGIGMSGCEAIYTGTPTICSMQETANERLGRYKNIPAIDIRTASELEEELKKLSTNKEYYKEISSKTKEWAKVLTYESTVKYLDEVLYNG